MSDEQATIRTMPNGPFVVDEGVALSRRSIVYSTDGEPLTWRQGEPVETDGTYALCRCGASANKPFCDGTHASIDFDGTSSEASGSGYDERAKELGGTRIVVRDDRSICTHAGFCGTTVTNVWKMVGDVDDQVEVRAKVMAMIERCPSGALTYRVEGDGADLEPEYAPGIGIMPDGPLWVTGGLTVDRGDGETQIEARNRVNLCRCGASANKPLCDGSHKEAGFTG